MVLLWLYKVVILLFIRMIVEVEDWRIVIYDYIVYFDDFNVFYIWWIYLDYIKNLIIEKIYLDEIFDVRLFV